MKKSIRTACTALLFSPLTVSAQATYPADSIAVAGIVSAFHAGLLAGDSTAALALLAPEAMILEAGDIETRAEYRAHHLASDIAATQSLPGTRMVRQVWVSGDAAWVASSSTTVGNSGGRAVDRQGAELMVLVRRDGIWRITAIHWSSRQRRSP